MLSALTIAAVATLAFANGANDVSKGIATLAGSRRATYRQAIAWGALWTGAGAGAAVVVALGLVQAFTSALVRPEVLTLAFVPLAVAGAASGWVLFASATALPVSTTHAITGAIVGVGLAAGGTGAVSWGLLLSSIAAPLALSPLVSAAFGYGLHGVARRVDQACVCADTGVSVSALDPGGTATAMLAPHVVVSGTPCEVTAGRRRILTGHVMHWGTAAALSFARGVNDGPKIAALGILALASADGGVVPIFAVTAAVMTAGSLTAGFRVSRTLGDHVVPMRTDTGLASAVVAAGLVLAASFYTLPVSTTHVSTGAIVGVGVRQGARDVRWRTVRSLVSAWLVTLPVSAMAGGVAAWCLRTI